ncbi:hypothetical protein SLH46_18045 [Draconibacterium sp. IB214405]|uniref:hypothetical protein n=1 Tax=Draconibacterium sp. IB214405 TaxID=3097352 RepID=UPI002A0D9B53|nr:hypothetical protein [Draconibacterium sp. IB214405]MDX8341106.1 hypothetical protein [Draconibacterium sp. IB214405]
MKQSIVLLIFTLLVFGGCKTKESITQKTISSPELSADEINTNLKQLTIEYNHLVVSKYLEVIEQTGEIPRLGYLDWDHVQTYWDSIPDLNRLRDDFENASVDWVNFKKEHDDNYKQALSLYENDKIKQKEFLFRTSNTDQSLTKKYPSEYRTVKGYQAGKLGISNRITLKYMIDDYDSKGKLFPISWIPQKHLYEIENDSTIQKISNEILTLENMLEEHE